MIGKFHMKLYINTTSNKQTVVKLDDLELVKESGIWRSQIVLPMIDEVLKSKNAKVIDITEIEVATGPGSFTGIRVGFSVAQALGYALNVPVNGNNPREFDKPLTIRYSI